MENDNQILLKLDSIQSELKYIKANMVEKDEIMVHEEFEVYKRSFDSDNLISLDKTKKELGL